MNTYFLQRKSETFQVDEVTGLVLVAPDARTARKLAVTTIGESFKSAKDASVKKIGDSVFKNERVIATDRHTNQQSDTQAN